MRVTNSTTGVAGRRTHPTYRAFGSDFRFSQGLEAPTLTHTEAQHLNELIKQTSPGAILHHHAMFEGPEAADKKSPAATSSPLLPNRLPNQPLHVSLASSPPLPTHPSQTEPSAVPVPFRTAFLISLISGTLSGSISSFVCAPLDIVKTRLQVQGSISPASSPQPGLGGIAGMMRQIVKREGPKGLFRGLAPTLATVPTFWGFYFPMYERFKVHYKDALDGDSSDLRKVTVHVCSAVSAGAFADCVTNPLWVIRTR